MGVNTYTVEHTSPLPTGRVFKALILDGDNLLPKLLPQVIKSVELIEGNGGAGSITKMTIAEGANTKYLKHRIDAVDEGKLTYSYTLIEGEDLLGKLESISYEVTFESTPEGGSIVKNVIKYHPKPGVEIKEEELKASWEKGMGIFNVVEAYLVTNPEAYA